MSNALMPAARKQNADLCQSETVSSPKSMVQERRLAENRFVIHYRCPSGDWGYATGVAECAGQPYGLCEATVTWRAPMAETRQVIDSAVTLGLMHGRHAPLIRRGHTLAVRR
jgi:hypothetical protein